MKENWRSNKPTRRRGNFRQTFSKAATARRDGGRQAREAGGASAVRRRFDRAVQRQ